MFLFFNPAKYSEEFFSFFARFDLLKWKLFHLLKERETGDFLKFPESQQMLYFLV